MNDSPLQILARIWESPDPLRRVESAIFKGETTEPPMTTGFRLWFGDTPLTLRADTEFDELWLDLDRDSDHPEPFTDVTQSDLWKHQVGRHAAWFWQLTNQQGGCDGLRVELVNDDHSLSSIFEFVVVASAIQLYSGQRIP